MTKITFVCPHCVQHISADESYAGVIIECPSCGKRVVAMTPNSDEAVLAVNNAEESEVGCTRDSATREVHYEKSKIYITLAVGAAIALVVVLSNQPKETGWWIFKSVKTPYQFLVGTAFLLAVGYLFLLVHWYKGRELCGKNSMLAFILSGGISIAISLVIYPIVSGIGAQERIVETGVWIFRSTQRVMEYEIALLAILHSTGAIAGLIEEPAKLAAVMLVSPVRRMIVDRKSGMYYVTLCAFGFALIENISYFHSYQEVLYIRANPAHAVFSSFWGAALGSLRAKEIGIAKFGKFFLLGIGLLALWNFLASTNMPLFLITFGLTIWLGLSFIRRELLGASDHASAQT